MTPEVLESETVTYNAIVPYVPADLALSREPEIVLAEAQRAAQALKKVIDAQEKKVVFNGKTYLGFESWQTVGRFYGITAKVTEVKPIEFGDARGFSAKAVALRSDGQEIGGAESMCLDDEANWSKKPLFQLASMAQTRAAAKALRGVLSWVVVLAGYEPTPAEEMNAVKVPEVVTMPKSTTATTAAPANPVPPPDDAHTITATIADVTIREGEKNGKPWKLYKIATEDALMIDTFDEALGDLAMASHGKECDLTYTERQNGKYTNRTLVSLTPF